MSAAARTAWVLVAVVALLAPRVLDTFWTRMGVNAARMYALIKFALPPYSPV